MLELNLNEKCNLADFLRKQNVPLKMSCGGHGSCATCRVIIDGKTCLSCQTELDTGRYEVEIPAAKVDGRSIQLDPAALAHGIRIDEPRHGAFSEAQSLQENSGTLYVAAVDLGTTTVSCVLIRLLDGEVISSRGRLNMQTNYATDVAARISFSHTPERRVEMQRLIIDQTLRPLIFESLKKAGIEPEQLLTTVIAGNTVMIHLLLGFDPTGLGGFPFTAVDLAPQSMPAKNLRLPGRNVEFLPAQSAYLGGDIISGLAALRFENEPDGTLFVDIGTNAEIALKVGERMLCTAVPAGPSFEGGGLSCGIPAVPGAIDRVYNDGLELKFSTIGEVPAAGLCGSGIISFVAAAYRAGILNKSGRLQRHHPSVRAENRFGNSLRCFTLTDEVYISEADIDAFLQAKAAIFSGIATLCEAAGIKPTDLTRVHIAGNFGRYVDLTDAIEIGLLPDLNREVFVFDGNLSLIGAMEAALDTQAGERTRSIIKQLKFIELNAEEHFQDAFINALFIPNYDRSLFPSIPKDAQRDARRAQRRLRINARKNTAVNKKSESESMHTLLDPRK